MLITARKKLSLILVFVVTEPFCILFVKTSGRRLFWDYSWKRKSQEIGNVLFTVALVIFFFLFFHKIS